MRRESDGECGEDARPREEEKSFDWASDDPQAVGKLFSEHAEMHEYEPATKLLELSIGCVCSGLKLCDIMDYLLRIYFSIL